MSSQPRVTLRGRWVGEQLKELRDAAGLTLQDAAEYLERSSGTVSRFESGMYPIRRPDLMALLDLYRIDDQQQRQALLKLREEVWHKGWWDGYADEASGWLVDLAWVESRVEKIRIFDVTTVNGLLQTQPYARTLAQAAAPEASSQQVERWVELRLHRQQVLDRDEPPHLAVVLDEAALRRRIGGAEIMRAQLDHLAEMAARPNIEVRVLPFHVGEHASTDGGFSLLSMPDPFPDVAYVEGPAGAIYLETPESDRFMQRYDSLRKASLSSDSSIELMRKTVKEFR